MLDGDTVKEKTKECFTLYHWKVAQNKSQMSFTSACLTHLKLNIRIECIHRSVVERHRHTHQAHKRAYCKLKAVVSQVFLKPHCQT